jgi:hypothetical protein
VESELFNQLCRRVRRDLVFLGKVLAESFVMKDLEIMGTDESVESFSGLLDERQDLGVGVEY